eukprot:88445-Prorocentrum_minimum.AAC.1
MLDYDIVLSVVKVSTTRASPNRAIGLLVGLRVVKLAHRGSQEFENITNNGVGNVLCLVVFLGCPFYTFVSLLPKSS